MRKRLVFWLLAVFSFLFFMLQFSARLIEFATPKERAGSSSPALALAAHLYPIDADLQFRNAAAMVNPDQALAKPEQIERVIAFCQRAIFWNPFYYQAHLYLGKAFIQIGQYGENRFYDSIRSFRRAAFLRCQDPHVGTSALKVFISLWPLLDQEDKEFTRSLFNRVITTITPADAAECLRLWINYCRDLPLLQLALPGRPRLYPLAAAELAQRESFPELRIEFLALNEQENLIAIQDEYSQIVTSNTMPIQDLEKLYSKMNQTIMGYDRLNGGKLEAEKMWQVLRRNLFRATLSSWLLEPDLSHDAEKKRKMCTFIIDYIRKISNSGELPDLADQLQQKHFFDDHDLRTIYLKLLLQFSQGDVESVINEAENLRQSFTFIGKEKVNDYLDIFFLMSDALIATRLLTRAAALLTDLKQFNTRSDEIYWRQLKVEKVIGIGVFPQGPDDALWRERLQENCRITVNSPEMTQAVYPVNGNEVEITLAADFRARFPDKHVLSIFINGRIVQEFYISQISGPFKILLPAADYTIPPQLRLVCR